MRLASILLLMTALPVENAISQQPVPASAQPGTGGHQAHRVMAPLASARAQGPAARSTAQSMAARAVEPLKQMPAFNVAGLDGKTVDIGASRSAGHWLLLYRPEHCLPCDKLMAALAKSENPLFKQGAAYVIVVKRNGGAATYGMLDQLKGSYPTLANATWVEDVDGSGFAALKPHGEPALYAVSGNNIAWTIHGTLNNPATLEKLAGSWLTDTSTPQVAAAAARPVDASAAAAPTKSPVPASHPQ